jgi:hypothetical protein
MGGLQKIRVRQIPLGLLPDNERYTERNILERRRIEAPMTTIFDQGSAFE